MSNIFLDMATGFIGPATSAISSALKPDTPDARSIYGEGKQSLDALTKLAPDVLSAERQYRPQYTDLSLDELTRFMTGQAANQGGIMGLYGNMANQSSNIMSQARSADMADVARLSPQAAAAYRVANPQQFALLDQLNSQAVAGLNRGGQLDPSVAREVTQAVRAGQAARGMGFGPADLYAEAMGRGMAGENRLRANQAFAGSVAGLNQATAMDPFAAVLNSGQQQAGMAGAMLSQGAGIQGQQAQPTMFDPFNPYASDVFNTNYNAEAAAMLAHANNKAAVIGGLASSL